MSNLRNNANLCKWAPYKENHALFKYTGRWLIRGKTKLCNKTLPLSTVLVIKCTFHEFYFVGLLQNKEKIELL